MKNFCVIIIGFLLPVLLIGQEINLIPEPLQIEKRNGSFAFSGSTTIQYAQDMEKTVELFNDYLDDTYDFQLKKGGGKNAIHLTLDKSMKPESYALEVQGDRVDIRGDQAGIFYGIQTLQQLIQQTGNNLTVPAVVIKDEPRFGYRGLMLDVGRYYQTPEYLKKFLDVMAHYKLNTFHWHLTEDAGWRIEIKKYPDLTKKGAWRISTQVGERPEDQDRLPHGGFYSQKEIRDIIQYAQDRQITIIPEIDMPGHMMAALAVFPELSCTGGPFAVPLAWGIKDEILCAGNEQVYTFLEDVLAEVVDLFPGEYIHIGGDEAPKRRWEECPKCQARIREEGLKDEHELQSYFIQRVEKFVNSKGKSIIGWDEILEGGLAPNATVMSWRGEKGGIAAASQGHDVIMTPTDYFYFDYYQSDDRKNEPFSASWGATVDLEKTYSFNPLPADIPAEKQKHVIGVQANLWGEVIHLERDVDYMTFPRGLAVAEIGWSVEEKRDYGSFLKRLPARLADLDRRGVTFRVPEAIEDIKTEGENATIALQPLVEGAEIRYTTDGSNPLVHGKKLQEPIVSPLKVKGIDFQYVITLPYGRSSAIYKLKADE